MGGFLEAVFPPRRVSSRELGSMGERRAVWYFRCRGYAVIARNLKEQGAEVDLIVRRGRAVAFVEVKSRQSRSAGDPHEAVDVKKQQRIARAAEGLARRLGLEQFELRFDVLSLYWTGRRFRIEHFPSAFRLMADARQPWKRRPW